MGNSIRKSECVLGCTKRYKYEEPEENLGVSELNMSSYERMANPEDYVKQELEKFTDNCKKRELEKCLRDSFGLQIFANTKWERFRVNCANSDGAKDIFKVLLRK